MSPERLFDRQVVLRVGGKEISAPPMAIDFRITFDADPEPDDGDITLYNLGDDTIHQIHQASTLVLSAGYGDDIGTIMAGEIQEVTGGWENVDRTTTIQVLDAVKDWARTLTIGAYAPGTKASQIIRDLLGRFGLEVGKLRLPQDVEYTGGKTVNGSLQDALNEIARDCGAKINFAAGAVHIAPLQEGRREAIVLRADTGLIESPQPASGDEEDKDYDVSSLLRHQMGPNSIVKIESRTANGWFRVVNGQHVCNDRDYMTLLEVVEA